MATPIDWPKARKKEYMATAKARSALVLEAWMAKAMAGKSIPMPSPETRLRKIQETVGVFTSRR